MIPILLEDEKKGCFFVIFVPPSELLYKLFMLDCLKVLILNNFNQSQKNLIY